MMRGGGVGRNLPASIPYFLNDKAQIFMPHHARSVFFYCLDSWPCKIRLMSVDDLKIMTLTLYDL